MPCINIVYRKVSILYQIISNNFSLSFACTLHTIVKGKNVCLPMIIETFLKFSKVDKKYIYIISTKEDEPLSATNNQKYRIYFTFFGKGVLILRSSNNFILLNYDLHWYIKKIWTVCFAYLRRILLVGTRYTLVTALQTTVRKAGNSWLWDRKWTSPAHTAHKDSLSLFIFYPIINMSHSFPHCL